MTRPEAPLRLLEVLQPFDGGVAEHVRRLTEGLAARGHEVTVAGPPDAALRSAIESVGASFEPVPFVASVPGGRDDLRSLARVGEILGSSAFDVVHAHAQKAGIIARIAARRTRAPSVYTPHSFVYRTQLLRPRRGMAARYRLNLWAERALGRTTTRLAACSEDERLAAIGDRIVPAARTETIFCGVGPDLRAVPDPRLTDFGGDGPLLGMVAGLRDQKGLPTLLDALELLAREGRAPRFAIVGNGPMREQVKARVSRPPLAATTLVTPFAGRVEPYLAALDAFVLPSYWEGLPIAVLEAMAMGLPVVASAVNGTPEAVDDGRTGFLVPAHDARALANALAAMAADPDRRRRFGEAGRAVAGSRFSLPRMVDGLESMYVRLRAGGDGGR